MKRIEFHTCDVFTETRFGGNQLAVLPDAIDLDPESMQRIAREFNYSETTFVTPSDRDDCDFKVRIFTPANELPFAGHPTVGTAFVLAATNRIELSGETARVTFEEGIGPVSVEVFYEAGAAREAHLSIDARLEWGPAAPAPGEIAAALGLNAEDIGHGSFEAGLLTVGVPFLMVPLRDSDAIRQADLNAADWSALSRSYASGLYVFAPVAGETESYHVRMFAPAMGVPEDPATGSAAVALGAYLERFDPTLDRNDLIFERIVFQGEEMERPSRLVVRGVKREGRLESLGVGGPSVLVSSGELFL